MSGFGVGFGPSTSVLGNRGEPQPLPATAVDGMPRSSVDTVPSIRSMPSRGHRSANARGHPRGATLAAGGYYGSKGWQNGYASQTSTDSEMFSMPALLTRSNTKRGEPLLEEPVGVGNAARRESNRSQSVSRTGKAGLSNGENLPSDASSPGHSSAQRLDQTSLSQRPSFQAAQLPSSYLNVPTSRRDDKQRQRLYRSHKGSNRFFIGGRLITADSNPAYFIASSILLAALGGLWLGFEASHLYTTLMWTKYPTNVPLDTNVFCIIAVRFLSQGLPAISHASRIHDSLGAKYLRISISKLPTAPISDGSIENGWNWWRNWE